MVFLASLFTFICLHNYFKIYAQYTNILLVHKIRYWKGRKLKVYLPFLYLNDINHSIHHLLITTGATGYMLVATYFISIITVFILPHLPQVQISTRNRQQCDVEVCKTTRIPQNYTFHNLNPNLLYKMMSKINNSISCPSLYAMCAKRLIPDQQFFPSHLR